MSKYFAADGALGIIMEKIADFLILSVLYLLFFNSDSDSRSFRDGIIYSNAAHGEA